MILRRTADASSPEDVIRSVALEVRALDRYQHCRAKVRELVRMRKEWTGDLRMTATLQDAIREWRGNAKWWKALAR